jgi:hypothetical protein
MSTTKGKSSNNGQKMPCQYLVTYSNKNGTQRILGRPSIGDAIDTLRAIAFSLGFTDLSGASSPAFPVAIWMRRSPNSPFERVFPVIHSLHLEACNCAAR